MQGAVLEFSECTYVASLQVFWREKKWFLTYGSRATGLVVLNGIAGSDYA